MLKNKWIKINARKDLMVRLSCEGVGLMTTAKPLEDSDLAAYTYVRWVVPLCIGHTFKFTGYQILRVREQKKNGFLCYDADKEVRCFPSSQPPKELKKGDNICIGFDSELNKIYFQIDII